MNSKKELEDLIKTIKTLTGLNQGKISVGAGYKENTLTQVKSKPDAIPAVINQLRIAYKETLKNSTAIIKKKAGKNTKSGDFNLDTAFKEIVNYLKDIQNAQTEDWNQGQMIRSDVQGVANYMMLKDAEFDPDKMRALKETYYNIVRGDQPAFEQKNKLKIDNKNRKE